MNVYSMSFENLPRNKCNMSTNRHATLDLMKRFEMIKFQKLISAQIRGTLKIYCMTEWSCIDKDFLLDL